MRNICNLPALEQAALIAKNELTSEEVTRAHLERIERLNPSLTAFVQLRADAALDTARRLDASRRRNPQGERGPLWGLPTGMKDLHFTRGFYARMGSRAYRYLWSPFDDVTSATIRKAGLVIVGKLSTSELAIMPVVEPDIHPPTRNPWDTSRSSGGSSGGSGAAVASGMIPLAAASDGGGSIRIPAAFCGLVGHKPTRGLTPNPHGTFDTVEISVIGPHARTVDDAAALLDVLAGIRAPRTTFLSRVQSPPSRMKIRSVVTTPIGAVEPPVKAAVERVLRVLERLGHSIEAVDHPEGSIEDFMPLFQYIVAKTPVPVVSMLQPVSRWLKETGKHVSLEQAFASRALFTRRTAEWIENADMLVTPTVMNAPPKVGAYVGLGGREALFAAASHAVFTASFNASGQPATTIPVWDPGAPGAYPIGVQLVGRHGDDARLLAIAKVLLAELGYDPTRIAMA